MCMHVDSKSNRSWNRYLVLSDQDKDRSRPSKVFSPICCNANKQTLQLNFGTNWKAEIKHASSSDNIS